MFIISVFIFQFDYSTAHSQGCFRAVKVAIALKEFLKDVCVCLIMTKHCDLASYLIGFISFDRFYTLVTKCSFKFDKTFIATFSR